MKKNLCLILTLALVLSLLAACGSPASSTPTESASAPVSAEKPTTPAESEPLAEPETSEAEPVSAAESSMEGPAYATVEYPLDETYTFTWTAIARNNVLGVIGDDPFDVTPGAQELARATGCTIEFTMLGEATAEEKININLASGDMTDFYGGLGSYGNNLTGAIADGILFDMVPMLDECAPDYKALLDSDPILAASAYNADGTLSKFVSQAADVVTKGMLIRQDWLDKLNKEAPTNREDLEEILKAFQTEFGATMPILVNAGLETGLNASFNAAFAGFRGIEYQLTEPDGPTVVANVASDNFIEYIVYLNHLYQEGLIIDDFMSTGREYGNWESTYYSGKCGVWADGYRELDPKNRSNADDPDYVVTPMALTDYECHVSERSTASMDGMAFVTAACEKPDLALKMMNYAYTEEGRKISVYGVEGESYELNDAGEIEFTEAVTNSENGWSMNDALIWYGATQWLPSITTERYYELVCGEEAVAGLEYWTEAYGDRSMRLPAAVTLDAEATSEFYRLSADVLTLITENATKVIIGQLDEAGYREVLKDAEGIGLTRMTELYQDAYDAYLANQ